MSMFSKLRTYIRLGLVNIARVAVYRLSVKLGYHPVQQLRSDVARGPFFKTSERISTTPPGNCSWDKNLIWFGYHQEIHNGEPPDWHRNPFSSNVQSKSDQDWWLISDFDQGDIKGVWELSRFDWVLAFATQIANNEPKALVRLNNWLANWTENNPPYKGVNWKCGQEASIRVIHMVTAAWILGQDKTPEQGLVDLLVTHLKRIAPTMSYAIGQQNNHGSSEAAALFLGGSFLKGYHKEAVTWERTGRKWLEKLSQSLIMPDGSFSQYSVNYHRTMLDSYSLVQAWQQYRSLPEFSPDFFKRLAAATGWLEAITNKETGHAPNIGANDGTRLLQFTDANFRDFRSSVQLAAALFEGRDAFGEGPWNAPLEWLSITRPSVGVEVIGDTKVDGGFHFLHRKNSLAVLRFANFQFRPSQSDILHLDFWHKGVNILRDAGTYSYNADGAEWFAGSGAHNTITFDGRDQMPRLGRFLFGDWIRSHSIEVVRKEGQDLTASAAYKDGQGANHVRGIRLGSDFLICRDVISGNFNKARLRWRLSPLDWIVEKGILYADGISIQITVDSNLVSPHISTSEESCYYQQKNKIPLIEVYVSRPATLVTKLCF